mgnify:CR=1 FL=1
MTGVQTCALPILSTEGKRVVHFFDLPPEAFHGKVPFPVWQLIKKLRELKAENVEGLFRLNGSDSKTKELCDALDRGPVEDWSKFTDIHTVATALKRYFRSMSLIEPLIPFDCFDCVIAMIALRDEEKEIEVCKSILKMLDKSRYNILGYLIDFLYFVSSNSQNNFMTPGNLAICLAPNICVSNADSSHSMNDSMVANNAVEFMIKNYKLIFPDFDVDSVELSTNEDVLECLAPPINMKFLEHQILKCNLRRNHTIKFLPNCKYSSAKKYKRPTRPPPPRPDSSVQHVVNVFDSIIIKMDQSNSAAAGFVRDIRKSVAYIDPIDISTPPILDEKPHEVKRPVRQARITPPISATKPPVQINSSNVKTTPPQVTKKPTVTPQKATTNIKTSPQHTPSKASSPSTSNEPIKGLVIKRTYHKANRRPPKAVSS